MFRVNAGIGLVLGGLLLVTSPRDPITDAAACETTRERETTSVAVGTFDSRGVLIAFVRSAAFQKYLTAQKTDLERAIKRAKKAGDRTLEAELNALGPAMQRRIHHQGFGTAPVDDILVRIADQLPGIAKKAGVDVIVSKWKLAYRSPSAKFVDVTEHLAAAFGADAETLKSIREVMAKEPVPLDQLSDHK